LLDLFSNALEMGVAWVPEYIELLILNVGDGLMQLLPC